MKKITALIVIFTLVLCAVGCGQGSTGADGSTAESPESAGSGESAVESSESAGTSAGSESTVSSGVAADEVFSRDIFAMDTYMSISAYGPHGEAAVEAGEAEIERLDALLSTGEETSEVAEINRNGGGTLSADGIELMKRSLELYEETDGRFDISIYPVMDLWGFTTEEYRVPSDDELAEALAKVDASKIEFDEESGRVSFDIDGMEIDFGGIAKGYTSQRLIDLYKEMGVTSGLVNLGGNVQVLGAKPDGSAWRIGIENPEEDGTFLGVVTATDMAVITSGGYERYFEEDGVTYHHIIDPATGYPAASGLISVSIVCPDGCLADGLSTSLFIMGEETAADFWRAHSDAFQVILETSDRELYVSEGLKDSFTSDFKIHYITLE